MESQISVRKPFGSISHSITIIGLQSIYDECLRYSQFTFCFASVFESKYVYCMFDFGDVTKATEYLEIQTSTSYDFPEALVLINALHIVAWCHLRHPTTPM